ncbi:PucR family transcriptional regulator [Nakamurella lactea]|uniref:PucR family transcriptional regulator n=1 Tax=Nakamurella lactea TaxID=459515 RepID=UPI0003F9CC67|nr:helix-turn-helix domain-containing protein [Nakamurella lactea]
MTYELQRLVENLGNRLNRSVAVDDPQLHLLAYNPHVGAVDSARTGSILKRSVPAEVVEYIYQRGAGDATDLFTVPARADLGLNIARIGMPVHHQNTLLGFVWMLASEGPVTDEQADVVRRAADTVALMLHREYLIGELSRGRERELVRDLLTDQAGVRARAATELVAQDLFSPGPAAVLVVTLARVGTPLSDHDRLALAAGVAFGRSRRAPRQSLALERPDHGVLVLSQDGPKARNSSLELGRAVRERVLTEAAEGAECWVGLGGTQPDPADLHDSYTEARRAAEVASVVRVLGPVVADGELGVYGLLSELPTQLLVENLHPGVRRILDRDGGSADALVLTVETYLDNAGEVQRTSDQLHIHRTSLYYRLKRVQEITGLDLSVGDDRLALQLGLKIARLIDAR